MSREGYVVPHGDTFGEDEDVSIAVRHISESASRPAAYELTLLKSAQLGYECSSELAPVQVDEDDDAFPDLDPDDPMDQAILKRLAERIDAAIQPQSRDIVAADHQEPKPMAAAIGGGFGRRQSPPGA